MADERTLRALLRFGIKREDIDEAKRGIRDVEGLLKDVERQMDRLSQAGEKISSVGMRLTAFGAAISGPFVLAARSYVQYAGQADEYSRRWLAATEDLEQSTIRIGRVAAEQLLPFLESAADLMERVAQFAEDNPGAIKAAVAIGGGATALGTLATTVGQLAVTVGAVGKIVAGLGLTGGGAAAAGGAAGTAGAGALSGEAALAAMGGGPLAGGLGAGAITGIVAAAIGAGVIRVELTKEALGAVGIAPESGLGSFITAGLDVTGVGGIVRAFEELSGIDIGGVAKDLLGLSESIDELGEGTAGGGGEIIPRAALDAYIAYQQNVEEKEREHGEARQAIIEDYNAAVEAEMRGYEERRAQLIEDFEERRAQATADFERRRERIERDFYRARELAAADFAASQVAAAADFARQEARAEQSYYAQRARRARDFGIEMARMEQDHQRQMRRLREDHEARETDLIAARDALGLVREQRSYERQRQDAEEDYQVRASRRNQDFAREMADMEAAFREQRAMRLEDFQRRQAEAQAAFEARRQQELEEYEQRRADEQEDFDLREQQEKKHHTQMLIELAAQHLRELLRMYNHRNSVLRELDNRHRHELSRMRTAFGQQLAALGIHLNAEKTVAVGYYALMKADFRNWLRAMRNEIRASTPAGVPYYQAGGYARAGLAFLHDREFVLNQATTQAAERMARGQLTQEKALALMARGTTQLVLQQRFSFTGRLAADEKEWYRKVARDAAKDAFSQVMQDMVIV